VRRGEGVHLNLNQLVVNFKKLKLKDLTQAKL